MCICKQYNDQENQHSRDIICIVLNLFEDCIDCRYIKQRTFGSLLIFIYSCDLSHHLLD